MNPLERHNDLKEVLKKYLKTANKTLSATLNRERDHLLDELFVEPFIEPLPMYKSWGTVDDLTDKDLPSMTDRGCQIFKEFISLGLMPGGRRMYRHQYEMLKNALLGRPSVITTGTSSGKTESFLMPLLATIINEAVNWPAANPVDGAFTFNRKDLGSYNKRRDTRRENRSAAVRAIIMYPMNALVDDQISRLRRTLDSDVVHEFMDRELGRNRIFFGKYNGNTPVAGHPTRQNDMENDYASRTLKEKLSEYEKTYAKLKRDYINALGDEKEHCLELLSFFPRVDRDSAEMLYRWEMQDTPPDIMITNYSMLSAMLMRNSDGDNDKSDADIFEKTKAWLSRDQENKFTLVVDELHLYRGTEGTEVAYLIRMLLDRLGLEPDSSQFRILASSASLDAADQAQSFLKGFFGKESASFAIITDENSFLPIELETNDPFPEEEKNNLSDDILSKHSGFIRSCLDRPDRLERFKEKLQLNDDQFKKFLDILDHSTLANLPRYRLHWMIRNSPGIFASAKPAELTPGEEDIYRTVGKISQDKNQITDEEGNYIYEVLLCEKCGTLFVAGYKSTVQISIPVEQSLPAIIPQSDDLEALPNGFSESMISQRRESEVGVFWPLPKGFKWSINPRAKVRQIISPLVNDANQNIPVFNMAWSKQDPERGHYWKPACLDPRTGAINLFPRDPQCNENVPGLYYCSNKEHPEKEPAMPPICPHCGSDHSDNKAFPSPIRQIRLGHDKYTQALAKKLFSTLGENEKKLLAFSDSRESAARLSHGIETTQWKDILRGIIYQELLQESLPQILTNHVRENPDIVDDQIVSFIARNLSDNPNFRNWINNIPLVRARANNPDLFSLANIANVAWRKLQEKGVCPNGPGIKDQNIGNNWWDENVNPDDKPRLKKQIEQILFSRNMFGIESIGVAFLDLPQEVDRSLRDKAQNLGIDSEVLRDLCRGYMRILGEIDWLQHEAINCDDRNPLYGYNPNAPTFNETGDRGKRLALFIENAATCHNINKESLRDAVKEIIAYANGNQQQNLLMFEKLYLRLPSQDEHIYRCPMCRNIHLHSA